MDDQPNAMLACTEAGKLFLLVPRQYETSVEVDDNGGLILRQEDGLGTGSAIYIARANISSFLERLIDLTPHGRCPYGTQSAKASDDETVSDQRQPATPAAPRRRSSSPAAVRQRRHRARVTKKKANVTRAVTSMRDMRDMGDERTRDTTTGRT
jgi:hypothetical protein